MTGARGSTDGGGSAALDDAVRAFVDDLAPEVEALGSTVADLDTARLRADVEVEAYNLTCAFIDADGLHTDDELWALAAAFGHRMPSDLGRATPAHIREAGLVVGRRALLGPGRRRCSRSWPTADARDGGIRAQRFERRGAHIGHTVAALDLLPSRTELAAIETFRATVQATVAAAAPRRRDGPTDAARRQRPGRGRAAAAAPPRPRSCPRPARSTSCWPSSTPSSASTASSTRSTWSPTCCGSSRSAASATFPCSTRAGTSCSPATRARARPPSPACWPRSTAR